jgi:hypothetical protein
MKILTPTLEDMWIKYKNFEDCEYQKDCGIPVAEFIGEWELKLKDARSVGCDYSSTILAFKLLGMSE